MITLPYCTSNYYCMAMQDLRWHASQSELPFRRIARDSSSSSPTGGRPPCKHIDKYLFPARGRGRGRGRRISSDLGSRFTDSVVPFPRSALPQTAHAHPVPRVADDTL